MDPPELVQQLSNVMWITRPGSSRDQEGENVSSLPEHILIPPIEALTSGPALGIPWISLKPSKKSRKDVTYLLEERSEFKCRKTVPPPMFPTAPMISNNALLPKIRNQERAMDLPKVLLRPRTRSRHNLDNSIDYDQDLQDREKLGTASIETDNEFCYLTPRSSSPRAKYRVRKTPKRKLWIPPMA